MADRIRHSARVAAIAASLLFLAGPAAAAGGLNLAPDPIILVILLVVFALLAGPVNNMVFQPIFRVLEQRDERIAGTRRRADEISGEAEELLGRYERTVGEARESAEQDRRSHLDEARSAYAAKTAEARADAESEVANARNEIAAGLDDARSTLRKQSEELAEQVAARVLGRSAT